MALLLGNWNLISFSATIVAAMHWHTLYELAWLVPILATILLCCRVKMYRGALGILLASVISLVQSYAFVRDANTLFDCTENLTIDIQIDSTLRSNLYFANSVVNILKIYACDTDFSGKVLLKVPVEQASQMQLGEIWRVSVDIKPIHGVLNEAGFDAQRYYFSQRVLAQAKVTKVLQRISAPDLRGKWFADIYRQTLDFKSQPLMLALLFGERSLIDKQQWHNLKQTGLAHLIAISGLHIGLAYMVGWWLGHILRIGMPKLIWLPLFSAVAVACFYAWLAGFSLPTQRAFIMCVIASLMLLLGIRISRWRVLWLTLAIVLMISPMSAVSSSLWLSVGAVALILLALDHIAPANEASLDGQNKETNTQRKFGIWLRVQLYLSLGLAPISALALGGVAWLSFLFNAVAIPLVSFYVVPLLLAGIIGNAFSIWLGSALFALADKGLNLLQYWVLLAQPYSLLWVQASSVQILCMLTLFSGACLRGALRSLALCIVLGVMAVNYAPFMPSMNKPHWQVDVLDVGHGLAILIESDGRALLYDTGSGWEEGSIAESIITPILMRRGVSLDALFISHWDNDHQGGMEDIIQQFSPPLIFSPQRDGRAMPCVRGQFWWWQGLSFAMVWPPKSVSRAFNPHSCVIRVSDGQHSLLLTGDIDAVAEYHLAYSDLQSEVMIVPHHGSNTSSTTSFIEQVGADIAIVSVAKQGRWSLPSQKVVDRYKRFATKWFETGTHGQVTVQFLSEKVQVSTIRHRQTDAWYRQILRNRVE
ncbi:DNA internalization-related competence protein ComEC/Rec2 [Vibrio sp. B1Z05]|uniref:DNA internalization-related competence protein ComEC/Rec2 n=1 Tax=Vibrio sp. B1Z05 TaxID=2654980 RepID=UPI0020A64D0A|nr:DNA internalization-related competence protein ComEC/Rec2 [Vibrio sp. B1Z05]